MGKYVQLRPRDEDRGPHTTPPWARALEFSSAVSVVLRVDGSNGTELAADERQLAQECALWELLALFSVHNSGEGVGGQDLARWLRKNDVAVAGSATAAPLPAALWSQLQEMALKTVALVCTEVKKEGCN